MSTQTEVLYGNRLYDQVTYSTNQDPQTFTATLSDSTSLSDARVIDTITQALSDLATLSDARIITSGTKVLTDTETLSDSIAKTLSHALSDSTSVTDSTVVKTITKAISELITLSEARIIVSGTKVLPDTVTLTESIAKILSHAFSDSTSLSDIRTITATKVIPVIPTITAPFPLYGQILYTGSLYGYNALRPLTETITVLDSVVNFLATKILTDTASLTDLRIFIVSRSLLDTFSIIDSPVVVRQTKGLSDFIILNEWLSIHLNKAEIWTVPPTISTTSGILDLYGSFLYSKMLYSDIPEVSWNTTPNDSTVWTSAPNNSKPLQLYGSFLYSKPLYGSIPTSTWTVPPTNTQENFTNLNGEGNVP